MATAATRARRPVAAGTGLVNAGTSAESALDQTLAVADELTAADNDTDRRTRHAHWTRWCSAQGVEAAAATSSHLLAYVHLHRTTLDWNWQNCKGRTNAIDRVREAMGLARLVDDDVRDYLRAVRHTESDRREEHPVDPTSRDEYAAMVTARPECDALTVRLVAALHLGRRGLSLEELTDAGRTPIYHEGPAVRTGEFVFDPERDLAGFRALDALLALPRPWTPPSWGSPPHTVLEEAWVACCQRAQMPGLTWDVVATCDENTFAWLCFHADRGNLTLFRDRAYLAAGWAMARRNDDLSHVRTEHRRAISDGDRFSFPSTKTGPLEHFLAHLEGCPLWCPACVVEDWVAILERLGHDRLLFPRTANGYIRPGPVLAGTMTRRLRKMAAIAGLDLGERRIGTRTNRISAATAAAEEGMNAFEIARTLTLHADPDTALLYIRSSDARRLQFVLPTP